MKSPIDKSISDSIANSKTIDISNYNPNSTFPDKGIYIGDFKSLANDKLFPALFYISQVNGLCFLTTKDNKEKMHKAMQSIVLRFLLDVQPGLVKLKMYDPNGLGDNLIYLSQLSEKIKGENILIDESELERMLQNLIAEIPTIIQKVLGSKHRDKTLIEYNREAGNLAKEYNLLIVTDYPNSFNQKTNKQLLKILQSGKRVGVFSFISFDTESEPQKYSNIDQIDLLNNIPCVYEADGRFYVKGLPHEKYFNEKFKFHLNTETPDNLEEVVDFINRRTKFVKKIKVSLLNKLTKKNLWKEDSSKGLETPIGKISSTDIKNFILSIPDGDIDNPHHCLIGGATGSGKTVLLHNIICNTAWKYSPDEIQFFLLDYKEGTEFKIYENLPHVKVLSVQSEREFGVSVLEFLNVEIEKRAKYFKEINVSNINTYNEKSNNKLPRIILVIDEFQRLLDGPIKISNYVSKSLDDIGRRGRSFGINMILSTQSLGGIDINQTLSHLGLRISLKLNTARDCDQLLGSGNHAPFAFTKKGEAIYNARGGLTEGNSRFQVAYIPDDKMKSLINAIREKANEEYNGLPFKQYIYDGSLEPDVIDNASYENTKQSTSLASVYIGEPVTLQEEHIFFKLRKQNESNVLITGQDTKSAVSIFKHSFYQIENQSTKNSRFIIFNKLNVDSEFYPQIEELESTKVISLDKKIEEEFDNVYNELKERITGKDASARIVLGFFDIYNIRNLRKSGYVPSDMSKKLSELLVDGSAYNIYCIIYAYSYNGLTNIIDTIKGLNDFDTKIVLRGGQGSKILGMGIDDNIDEDGIGIVSSPFSVYEKVKFYRIKTESYATI